MKLRAMMCWVKRVEFVLMARFVAVGNSVGFVSVAGWLLVCVSFLPMIDSQSSRFPQAVISG
jgi:hypothetical protein